MEAHQTGFPWLSCVKGQCFSPTSWSHPFYFIFLENGFHFYAVLQIYLSSSLTVISMKAFVISIPDTATVPAHTRHLVDICWLSHWVNCAPTVGRALPGTIGYKGIGLVPCKWFITPSDHGEWPLLISSSSCRCRVAFLVSLCNSHLDFWNEQCMVLWRVGQKIEPRISCHWETFMWIFGQVKVISVYGSPARIGVLLLFLCGIISFLSSFLENVIFSTDFLRLAVCMEVIQSPLPDWPLCENVVIFNKYFWASAVFIVLF